MTEMSGWQIQQEWGSWPTFPWSWGVWNSAMPENITVWFPVKEDYRLHRFSSQCKVLCLWWLLNCGVFLSSFFVLYSLKLSVWGYLRKQLQFWKIECLWTLRVWSWLNWKLKHHYQIGDFKTNTANPSSWRPLF